MFTDFNSPQSQKCLKLVGSCCVITITMGSYISPPPPNSELWTLFNSLPRVYSAWDPSFCSGMCPPPKFDYGTPPFVLLLSQTKLTGCLLPSMWIYHSAVPLYFFFDKTCFDFFSVRLWVFTETVVASLLIPKTAMELERTSWEEAS